MNTTRGGDSAAAPSKTDFASLPARFADYELQSVLGQGAFGTVYRARDLTSDRDVAIKVPRAGMLETEDQIRRFLREAQTGARLEHPSICSVLAAGEHEGRHYLVMELIEGKTLSEYILRDRPLNSRTAAKVVFKLARALAHAHRLGIIHRDLKPANIVFEEQRQELVILDFGLAKNIQLLDSQQTASGQVLGTPAYMSPEQARGEVSEIGPRSDVYSLGVVLYELLTGRLPFEGSPGEVIAQLLFQDAKRPSVFREDLDIAIENICLKAMAKDVEDRFESMAEFAGQLKLYIEDPDQLIWNQPAQNQAMPDVGLTNRTDDNVVISPTSAAAESVDGYKLRPPEKTPDIVPVVPKKQVAPESKSSTPAANDIVDEFLWRMFGFMANVRIVVGCLAASGLLLSAMASETNGNYAAAGVLGVVSALFLSLMFSYVLSTTEHDDRKLERRPGTVTDLFRLSVFVLFAAIVAFGPVGLLMWPVFTSMPMVAWIIVATIGFLLFPVVLWSMVDSGSVLRVMSRDVVHSLSYDSSFWMVFYQLSFIGFALVFAATMLRDLGLPFAALAALLIVFIVLRYARALGLLLIDTKADCPWLDQA